MAQKLKIQRRIRICLSGVYVRSEEQKRKIGESRKKFYDEHGRVVEIDQRLDHRSYNREYQKIWRKKNPHYYRDLKRNKLKEAEEMKKTMKQEVEDLKNEITRLQNIIADLEMKMCLQNTTQKEDIDYNLYASVPSTQACSEEELMKSTEHK